MGMTGATLIDQVIDVAKQRGINQKELAARAKISEESLSRAKKRGSTRLDMLQNLAKAAGLEIGILNRDQKLVVPSLRRKGKPESFRDRYRQFAWSNPKASEEIVVRQMLLRPSFQPILDAAVALGFEKVNSEWQALLLEAGPQTLRAAPVTERILRNIKNGLQQTIG